jgi:hypothetical protein
MTTELGQIKVDRRTGSERFKDGATNLEFDLLDFWQWSASDLVANISRGVLAEYLVARALAIDVDGVRDGWAAYDLCTPDGIRIEVKSSAYLQSWQQNKATAVNFRIPPTRAWDPKTSRSEQDAKRQADVYVFALLAHRDKPTLDPLDVSQWEFYVLPTEVLNRDAGEQRSVSLAGIKRMGAAAATFQHLAQVVRDAHNRPQARPLSGEATEAGKPAAT